MTDRQRLFVDFYLGESKGNATQAARLAGCKWPRVAGPRLLTTVEVGGVVRARFEAELAAIETEYRRWERARLAACMARRRGR